MATKILPWSNVSKNVEEVSDMLINFKAPPKFPPNFSIEGKEFLSHCFKNAPEKRMSAKQLLSHNWLSDFPLESPIPLGDKKSSINSELKLKGKNLRIVNKDNNGKNQNESKPLLVNILKSEDNCGDFSVTISVSDNDEDQEIEEKIIQRSANIVNDNEDVALKSKYNNNDTKTANNKVILISNGISNRKSVNSIDNNSDEEWNKENKKVKNTKNFVIEKNNTNNNFVKNNGKNNINNKKPNEISKTNANTDNDINVKEEEDYLVEDLLQEEFESRKKLEEKKIENTIDIKDIKDKKCNNNNKLLNVDIDNENFQNILEFNYKK